MIRKKMFQLQVLDQVMENLKQSSYLFQNLHVKENDPQLWWIESSPC